MSNHTIGSSGRLGNQIIRNTICSLLAEKYNLKFTYGYEEKIDRLGLPLFKNGTNYYNNTIALKDEDFFRFFYHENLGTNNIYTLRTFFQNQEIANFLRKYYESEPIKQSIMDHNIYRYRYNNNNDVYVHVRLGDVIKYCPTYQYYEMVLEQLSFKSGYISSDSLNHEICQKLINKYNLQPLIMGEVETIMFATTCKNIVLTNGTMGWYIGVFSWFSKVYYPNLNLRPKYHGDIFNFPDWTMINYEEFPKTIIDT